MTIKLNVVEIAFYPFDVNPWMFSKNIHTTTLRYGVNKRLYNASVFRHRF